MCLYGGVLWIACGCDSDSTSNQNSAKQAPAIPDGTVVDAGDRTDNDPASASQPEFNRESSLSKAERLMRSGQTQEAIVELQRVLLSDPEDAEVLFRLANAQASHDLD